MPQKLLASGPIHAKRRSRFSSRAVANRQVSRCACARLNATFQGRTSVFAVNPARRTVAKTISVARPVSWPDSV